MTDVTTSRELDAALQAPEALLLKHGTHCPISAAARRELAGLAERHPRVPLYAVEVTGHRDLSDTVAERTGLAHQSPQLILLRDGRPAWHATHFGITAQAAEAQLGA